MESVIVSVRLQGAYGSRDFELPADVPAAILSAAIARVLGWDRGPGGLYLIFDLQATPPGRRLETNETLAQAHVRDSAELALVSPRSAQGDPLLGQPEGVGVASDGQPETKATFARPPRDYITPPEEEIVLHPPENAPTPPNTSLVSVLLPVLGTALALVIALVAGSAMRGGAVPIYLFISAPMLLVSVIGGLYSYRRTKMQYEQSVVRRKEAYLAYLAQQRQRLTTLTEQQRRASLTPNPSVEECVRRAERKGLRLWERGPGDSDFLQVRLGTGAVPTSFTIKQPDTSSVTGEPDPLAARAQTMAESCRTIADLAITLDLATVGSVGLVGPRASLIGLTRAALVQIGTHHTPSDVRLVVLAPEGELAEWAWARWLPHIWTEGRQRRLIAVSEASTSDTLRFLEDVLKQRKNQPAIGKTPRYVVVFADPKVWMGTTSETYAEVLNLILRDGDKVGASAVFIAESRDRVPNECGAVVIWRETEARLELKRPEPAKQVFRPDSADASLSQRLAYALAPLALEGRSGGDLPARITLVDMFGVSRAEEIPLEQLWQIRQPFRTLAIPIGVRAGHKPQELDFQEADRSGFGSHGLVGGTTGTGKTRLLQTLIVLLCAHYRPDDLSVVLVDYKGRELARGLESLPHLVGSLSNLENHSKQVEALERLFAALDREIQRRKGILAGRNINTYIESHVMGGRKGEPLSHLFVVIDEFAELIRKNRELRLRGSNESLRDRILSIGTIGRSIGVHLILATQSPGTIVDPDLRDLMNTRVCLRMGSREASKQILDRTEAYDVITKEQVGRAFVQVGHNEVFEEIQVAWAGASNTERERELSLLARVKELDLDGTRHVLAETPLSSDQTQLEALTALIANLAERQGICCQPPVWLPDLPDRVFLDVLQTVHNWDGTSWHHTEEPLRPLIGIADDPEKRCQAPARLSLSDHGHFLLFGSPGTGKSTFIQTLIASLALDHSPDTVQFYLLDFGGLALSVFETMPHVGAVILPDEIDRLQRLFRFLKQEMTDRKAFLKQHPGLVTMARCREAQVAGARSEIVLVLDNYSSFAELFKNQVLQPEVDLLVSIVSEGANLGIHLVITASAEKGFTARLKDGFSQVGVLELNDPSDYLLVVGKLGGLLPASGVKGRGLLKGTPPIEFQTALPGLGDTDRQRLQSLRGLADTMDGAWTGNRPLPVRTVPERLLLADLLNSDPGRSSKGLSVRLGVDLNRPELPPITVDLADGSAAGPHFWVSGSPSGGKTTLLRTWLLALAKTYPPEHVRFYIIDPGGYNLGCLRTLPHVTRFVDDPAQTAALNLQAELMPFMSPAGRLPELLLVVEGFGIFRQRLTEASRTFLGSVLPARDTNFHVIAAGTPQDFTPVNNPLADGIKACRSGFMLGSNSQPDATNTFYFQIRREDIGRPMPPGNAFAVQRGQYQVARLAACADDNDDATMRQWVDEIGRLYGYAADN